jgi:hypothetical protein
MELYALRYEKARPHYLFAGSDIPQNLIDINRRLRKLQIIQYDGSNNHEKLPGVISSLSEQVYLRRREMLAALASK